MPLALRKTEYRAYETVPAALDPDAAQAMLEEQLADRLEKLVGEDGEVVQVNFAAREAGGILTVTAKAECREQIGREVTFEGTVGETTPAQPLPAG